ncbi:MAG TPA: hypothetical protein VL652_34640 [Kutzneria sp.]|jgi:hypothetical protein|nr:hypothetical protein [Kutzneria sp.]
MLRVIKTCRVYYNYGLHDLIEGEQIPPGEFADFLLAGAAPVEEVTDGPAVDGDGDGVPDGTIAQVLEWVGEDATRAAAALEAENHRDAPRAGVLAALAKLVPQD